ncbi:hypothetical protein ABPG74_021757 [Tetrahymena malaccensis]
MSDNKKESEELQTTNSSNKKSIRFVQEQYEQDDQIPSGNLQKSVNTSRAVSDSTREGEEREEDIDDIVDENQSKFKHIKSIDVILPHCEDKLTETVSPSKKVEKSLNASSLQSENQDDNLSVHFGGLEILDENEGELPKFEYEPDDVPMKSILKNDLNRSRNISFDVRMLKDIEGKIISHDNLSMNPDDQIDNDLRNSILKNCQFNEDSISQGRSQGSGIMNKSIDSNEDEDDYFQDENQNEHKIEFRNRLDSEVRFKLIPTVQEASEKPIDTSIAKRNSLLFPAYSILKNSPLVQPSEFKSLKQIEKVANHSHRNSTDQNALKINQENESGEESEDSQGKEESDVRFVGDIVLQDESAYKFKYNPEENPKKPIIKRGSCITHAMTPTASISSQFASIGFSNVRNEENKKKRMSYDFLNLKNVDGKVIKHWQQKVIEDTTLTEDQNRDIKFGGIEILETDKLGDQAHIASKAIKPQKPILKTYRGRSCSLDFKKPIKNIDGVYIRKTQNQEDNENEEDEKVVHFGEVQQAEENNANSNNPGNNLIAQNQVKQISINLNLIRQYNSQTEEQQKKNEDQGKKSILKRSSSVQMRKPPTFNTSNDNTPTTKKKSNFSNRKIEIKENLGFDIPTSEIFTANWTSIRNDYIESALKFLVRIDTKNLPQIFQHGMQPQIFSQIIEVLHERTENDAFVKSYIENLYKIKNFQSLLYINKYQQDTIQEILDSLEQNHSIDEDTYNQLCSIYILKQSD